MHFKLFVLFIVLFLCQYSGVAQEGRPAVVEPPKDEPWTGVLAMTQDPQGYLWLATKEGVYKYDGHQYTLYQHEITNPNSLSLNWVESIFAGKDGTIWVGTFGGGLDRFDPSTNVFTHYHHQQGNAGSLINDKVAAIIQDRDGAMWVGTLGGLEKFDPKTNAFTHFVHSSNDPYSLSDNAVRALYEDKQGTIWVGTGSPFLSDDPDGQGGLNRLDKKTGKFTRYLHNAKDPHSLIDNTVRAIFEDSRGILWVGTAGDGLHAMDREKGIFQRYTYDPAHPEKLSRPPQKNTLGYGEDHITFINEDKSGKIWIGTFEGGINIYDPATQKTTWYGKESSGTAKLKADEFWCSYKSRDGVFWVGAWASPDLYKVSPYQNKPPYNYLGQNVIHFTEAADNALRIATNKGLIYQDKNNNRKEFYYKNAIPGSKGVHKTEKDDEQDAWIPNGDGGLFRFNFSHQEFTFYHHQAGNSNSLLSDTIVAGPQKDDQGNLWIPTFRGLDEMNIKTGVFRHFLHNPNDSTSISSNLISTVYVDKNHTVWVATNDRLNKLDQKTMQFRKYRVNFLVQDMLNDSRGDFWLGTDHGLYKYNNHSDSFSFFGTDGAEVFGIMEDRKKNLWLRNVKGYTRLNLQTRETTLFGKNQGLIKETLLSEHVRHDGQVLLGDTGGYFAFYPDKLLHSTPPSIAVINSFLLADAPVTPSMGGVLTGPLTNTNEIHLNHSQTIFSFGFTNIDFVNDAAGIRNLYILENYDSKWRKGTSDQIANYYNVPPGKYIFKVKSINNNGLYTEKSVAVIISPPWWQTWWAYVIFFLLFAGSIWSFIHYRSLSLLRDKRVLEKRVHERTEEVLQQKEEIEAQRDHLEKAFSELKTTQTQLIQSEKMASLGELTAGIAHEIQNPLNFVNNFSEVNNELIDEMQQEIEKGDLNQIKALATDIKENGQKINMHGKRADAIVKGMLQHSRVSNNIKEPTDINQLAGEHLRLAFHGLRARDKSFNVELATHFDDKLPSINVVPQDIGRVLLNLINNAFYAVQKKQKTAGPEYKPIVELDTLVPAPGRGIEIKIKDNGSGIPNAIKDKIMQPFFTTKPTGEGTGLGLSLSYDIVVKGHGGSINIKSTEGEGSEFTVSLPYT
ncbi:MAG TPA: two-component regulator propeller domain-containing protein [Mucilaginibacter sp.]|jgi:signal transduction histidine kinase/ligand-binding sensor domain-containing protein